jgi:hypothetical protein
MIVRYKNLSHPCGENNHCYITQHYESQKLVHVCTFVAITCFKWGEVIGKSDLDLTSPVGIQENSWDFLLKKCFHGQEMLEMFIIVLKCQIIS